MKKIFITIPWFLPAYRAGGPIRSVANLVENYKDATFYIFTGETDITGAMLNGIETGKWISWNSHTHVWYARNKRTSHELTKQVSLLKPDVIFMIGLYSWYFTLVPLLFCKAPEKIISVRGMLHPGALAQKSLKKLLFLKGLNYFVKKQAIAFHATDEKEKGFILNNLGSPTRVFVAGNFPTSPGLQPMPAKQQGSLKLITIALISPMKNILKILRQLANVRSIVEYSICGAVKDEEYWQQCRNAIRDMPLNIRVAYHDPVHPDKIKDILADHHVFILPSESENFGHAIFEALSAGRPVITSYHTPYHDLEQRSAGLNVHPGAASDIADAVNFFADMDGGEYAAWSAGAAGYAGNFWDKEMLIDEYNRMFGS